jgi:hypothetical protein
MSDGAVFPGIVLLLHRELIEEPHITVNHLLLELFDIVPMLLTCVRVVLLSHGVRRQRDEHLQIIDDLEIARPSSGSALAC